MTVAMKIRKGDTVHILAGKDRGKEARDRRDAEQRKVLVENLNLVKRHTKPRPLRDSSRMGGPQVAPGGIIEKPVADPHRQRDARLPDVPPADPRRHRRAGSPRRKHQGPRLQARRLGQEIDK
jgi:hypothetical protein